MNLLSVIIAKYPFPDGNLFRFLKAMNFLQIAVVVPSVVYHLVYHAPVGKSAQVAVVDVHIGRYLTAAQCGHVGFFLGHVAVHGIKLQPALAAEVHRFVQKFTLPHTPQYQQVPLRL